MENGIGAMESLIFYLQQIFTNSRLSMADLQHNSSVLLARFSILPIQQLQVFVKPITLDEIARRQFDDTTTNNPFKGLIYMLSGKDMTVELEEIIRNRGQVLDYSYLGLSYFRQHQFEKAQNVYSEAIIAFPAEPYFYACRCLMNRAIGDEEGAFYDYQVAKKLDFNYHSVLEWQEYLAEDEVNPMEFSTFPDLNNVEEVNGQGLNFLQNLDYISALTLYDRVLDAYPMRAEAFVYRGNVYLKMALFERALQDMEHALQIDERIFSAYVGKAKVYESYQWYEEALSEYQKALLVNATVAVVYEERAGLFVRLHRYDEAIRDFDHLIDLDAEDFYPYVLRAEVKETLNDWEGALFDYDVAIALNPYYSDLYNYRSEVKKQLGDRTGAELDRKRYQELEDE